MYLFVYKLKLQKYPISFLFIFKKVSLNNNKIIKVVVISNTTQVKKEKVKLSISIQIKIQKERVKNRWAEQKNQCQLNKFKCNLAKSLIRIMYSQLC